MPIHLQQYRTSIIYTHKGPKKFRNYFNQYNHSKSRHINFQIFRLIILLISTYCNNHDTNHQTSHFRSEGIRQFSINHNHYTSTFKCNDIYNSKLHFDYTKDSSHSSPKGPLCTPQKHNSKYSIDVCNISQNNSRYLKIKHKVKLKIAIENITICNYSKIMQILNNKITHSLIGNRVGINKLKVIQLNKGSSLSRNKLLS